MKRCLLPVLLPVLLLPGIGAAEPWQDVDDIRSVAEAFARDQFASPLRRISAGSLDPRMRLRDCARRLEAFLPPGHRAGANMTVGVRCPGATPWKVYVPVRSRLTGTVLVARRSLPRGEPIGPDDVTLAERDVDRLPYGYLTDPAAIVGRVTRRAIAPGAVLTPPLLGQATAVRRGQAVTLYADQAGIRIRMAGRALMDGAVRQRIRVENLSSGRVVEGVVRSAERVEVLMN